MHWAVVSRGPSSHALTVRSMGTLARLSRNGLHRKTRPMWRRVDLVESRGCEAFDVRNWKTAMPEQRSRVSGGSAEGESAERHVEHPIDPAKEMVLRSGLCRFQG